MRFTLLSLILAIAVVALTVVLIVERMTNRTTTISSVDTSLTWQIERELIDQAPVWTDKSLPPPLGIGDALRISDEIIYHLNRESKNSNIGGWEISSVGIVPLTGFANSTTSQWCYVVHFSGYNMPMHSGPPCQFSATILMDESVLIGENYSDPGNILIAAIKDIYHR